MFKSYYFFLFKKKYIDGVDMEATSSNLSLLSSEQQHGEIKKVILIIKTIAFNVEGKAD